MTTPKVCAQCGNAIPVGAPAGACPRCLMGLGVTAGHTSGARIAFIPPAPQDLIGLPDDLRVDSLIGCGGMGAVYKAHQAKLERFVAIKIMPLTASDDPAFAERFLREAQVLARLNHPHIVAVYDTGRTSSFLYITMEFVDGASLRDLISAGRLSAGEALRLVPQICQAMQYAHDHGIVHRDIKPENVLIDQQGRVKVIDFGIARLARSLPGGAEHLTLTQPDARLGTARYIAPEQLRSPGSVDHRADIYSLGVLFYEMLTGEVPAVDFQPPSRKSDVDRRVDPIVSRSLRESPDQRYQRAADLGRDVERLGIPAPRRALQWVLLLLLLSVLIVAGTLTPRLLSRTARSAPASPMAADSTPAADPQWADAENLGPLVNAPGYTSHPYLSADSLLLLFESTRAGGMGSYDLWQCQRQAIDAPWDEPQNLGPAINTERMELNPCISPDGLTLIFARNISSNDLDLLEAHRAGKQTPWDPPTALGPDVNTPGSEGGPCISADGLTLWFHRDGDGLWSCRRASPTALFDAARPLRVIPDPSARDPRISADGLLLIWSASTSDGPGTRPKSEFWCATRKTPATPFSPPRRFAPELHTGYLDLSPFLSPDARTLLFDSNRPGGLGAQDLWVSHRK